MDFVQLTELAAQTVQTTQKRFPKEIQIHAQTVPIHYEAFPDDSVLAEGFEPDILGLFTGSEHGMELSHDNPAPPQILLYLENLWEFAEGDPAIFREEVRITYLHELGHYFGWTEDDLAERGLD